MSITSPTVDGSLEVGGRDASGMQDAGEAAAVTVAPEQNIR